MMLISVIIPAYNAERFLVNCLDSVQQQTYINWQAIIIDDGSTDRSGQIAEEYAKKDSRFTVVHKKNAGLCQARLDGIQRAEGDILMFLDSDDSFESSCLEKVKDIFVKHDPDIVMFPGIVVTEDGVEMHRIGHDLGENGFKDKRMLCEKLLTCHDFNSVWLKAYKQKLFDMDNIRENINVHMPYAEDKGLLLPLIDKAESIYFLKDVLYRYTYNTKSLSHHYCASKIQLMLAGDLYDEIYRYMAKWKLDDAGMRQKIGAYYLRNVMECYYRMRKYCVDKEERKKFQAYPWKDELGHNMSAYLLGHDLTLKEKIKLLIMRVFVR